jgi:hypothetical protein
MKSILKYTLAFSFLSFTFFSCDEVINPTLEDAEPVVVSDAWLNNAPGNQTIKITRSQPYFNNDMPAGVSGAIVSVADQNGKVYSFVESDLGMYTWTPLASEVFGTVGNKYSLSVRIGSETFVSESRMGRVPMIDSVNFILEEGNQFFDDQYQAEFWATDPIESGDAYWIKFYKNGQLQLKPSEIITAYDAGFSKGGNFNGVPFIVPIRRAINPFDEADDGTIKSPYALGDSVYVQINAVSEGAFNFLNEVSIQTNRPGGFGELFATPLANVSTNIRNASASGSKVVGFFNVGASAGRGRKFKSLADLSEK